MEFKQRIMIVFNITESRVILIEDWLINMLEYYQV